MNQTVELNVAPNGDYDEACVRLARELGAAGVALIVYHGTNGNGISIAGPQAFAARLPEILEEAARGIRDAQRRRLS